MSSKFQGGLGPSFLLSVWSGFHFFPIQNFIPLCYTVVTLHALIMCFDNWVFAACNGLLGHIYISMEKLGDFILRYPFAHMIISADLTAYVLLLASTMEVFFPPRLQDSILQIISEMLLSEGVCGWVREGGRDFYKWSKEPKAHMYEWQTGLHTVQEILQSEML